jgi:hypothetical protein
VASLAAENSKYYFRHLFIFGDCQRTAENKKLIFSGWLVAAENRLFSAAGPWPPKI